MQKNEHNEQSQSTQTAASFNIELAVKPSQSKISQFFANAGYVISGRKGDVEANAEQQKICLLFSNGDFLVDEGGQHSFQVRNFRMLCNRKKISIKKTYLVNIKLIRLLYDEYQRVAIEEKVDREPMEIIASDLIIEAVSLKASDIHVKVYHFEAEIWFRCNGDMLLIRQIPSAQAHAILSALYNASEDSDATYRIYDYQAARITKESRITLPASLQAVRMQFNPFSAGGRYLIARLLYAENWWDQKLELSSMGFHPSHIKALSKLRLLSEGVNIISGPTGSGKSTTLKTILELLYEERQCKVNIITIEDPPEYDINGAAQLPVTNVDSEEKRGQAYSRAIVAALRSDPDVIMPGEARDGTVINLVFTAAMTGHQVWTSIHANAAPAIFDRLRDQGVEDYKLSDPSLMTSVTAQRLIKRLCPHCALKLTDYPQLQKNGIDFDTVVNCVGASLIDRVNIANEQGCSECDKGFSGRTVVAEIILPDQQFLDLILSGKRLEAINYWLEHLGGITMGEHAWLKIVSGLVDPFDVWTKISNLDKITTNRKSVLINMV